MHAVTLSDYHSWVWQLANVPRCIGNVSRQLAWKMFSSVKIYIGTSILVNWTAECLLSTLIVSVDIWWIPYLVNRTINGKIYNQKYTENVRYTSLSCMRQQWHTDMKRLDKLHSICRSRLLGSNESIIFLEQWCAHHSAATTTRKCKMGSFFVRGHLVRNVQCFLNYMLPKLHRCCWHHYGIYLLSLPSVKTHILVLVHVCWIMPLEPKCGYWHTSFATKMIEHVLTIQF